MTVGTIYNAFLTRLAKGDMDFDTAALKVMLVTSAYAINRDTHVFRSDVTNEVVGAGYTTGGASTAASVAGDNVLDRTNISLTPATWPSATITARAAIVYVDKGSAATDELIAYCPFATNESSVASAFAVAFSQPLRLQG